MPWARVADLPAAYHYAVRTAYRHSTGVLAALLVLLGVAMVASTLARGGGALSLGVVLGVPLALLGSGRLYLLRAQGRPRADA